MNEKKGSSLEVRAFYQKAKDSLKIRPASGIIGFSRKADLFFSQKGYQPFQIWGKKEIQTFNQLSLREKREFLEKRLKDKTFCLILADDITPYPKIEEEAKKRRLALFYSKLSQKICQEKVKKIFLLRYADQITISGGLVQISGLGVLIVGDSGIGKSESALELVSRGYRFVCDDAVCIKRKNSRGLIGEPPLITRYFMEIRGLGVINIKEIFGPKSIAKQSKINLVINLKKKRRGKEENRLGLKFPEDYELLGVKIPQINIPVAPGRNIATLIEIACKVFLLKENGYHAPQELVKKLNRTLSLR